MGCIIYDKKTGERGNWNQIPSHERAYEFDSGEEALLELVVGNNTLEFTLKTRKDVEEIVYVLSVRGVKITTHYIWRNYIFYKIGNIWAYVGQMRERKQETENNDDDYKDTLIEIQKTQINNLKKSLDAGGSSTKKFEPASINRYSIHERRNLIRQIEASILKNERIEVNPIKNNNVGYQSLPSTTEKHSVYLLYCKDTPHIYYIGRSRNVKTRFNSHVKNHPEQQSKPKHEWVKYIYENNFKLEYKILFTGNQQEVLEAEKEYIIKYIDKKENVVLNFTSHRYSAHNSVFLKRFKSCLYEKKIIKVNNYNVIAQNKTVVLEIDENRQKAKIVALTCDKTPNKIYITHAFINTDLMNIVERNQKSRGKVGTKHDWVNEVNRAKGEMEIMELETCAIHDAGVRVGHWIRFYHNKGMEVVNNNSEQYLKKEIYM